GGDVAIDSKVSEEGRNFAFAHFPRMAFVVKDNELLYPINIGLFSADAVMLDAQGVAHLVEQFGHRTLSELLIYSKGILRKERNVNLIVKKRERIMSRSSIVPVNARQ